MHATAKARNTGPSARDNRNNARPTLYQPTPPNPQTLVQQAQAGSQEAFEQLYRTFKPIIAWWVRPRVPNAQIAEDIAAETLWQAWRTLDRYSEQPDTGGFRAWLATIAHRAVADHYRRPANTTETPAGDTRHDVANQAATGDTFAQADARMALTEALSQLPADWQTCIVLGDLGDLPGAEVAERMGRSPGAVRQMQVRARQALARRLEVTR